jgi:hypothetical protein
MIIITILIDFIKVHLFFINTIIFTLIIYHVCLLLCLLIYLLKTYSQISLLFYLSLIIESLIAL